MSQQQLSAAAHAMLYESRGTVTDLEGIADVVTLQSGLHVAETSVVQLKHEVYRLQQDVQDALIRENVLQGRLRTRSRAAASVRKAMLEDLLALRSQLQYYEQHGHNSSDGDSGSGPPMGDQPYNYASYLNIGRLLEGDEDGLGVDDGAYLPDDVVVVQRMLFGEASKRLKEQLEAQKQRIRAVCDDRVAATEAKIRRMRVQFQEACRVQQECEARISDVQSAAEHRIQNEIESTAAVTTEYIRKFKDEAEATIDQLSVKVSDVTMLLETAQAENEVLADRLERMQHTKKAVAAKQLTELEQNLDLLYRQVLGKEEELTAAKKQGKETQTALESQKQRADILQEELRRRSDVIETLDQTVSDMKREKEKMARAFRDDLQRVKDSMEEEISKRVAEAHPPTDPEELEEKCREVLELKELLAETEQHVGTLQTSLRDAQEAKRDQTIANLAAAERLENELATERRRNGEVQAALEALEQKLQYASGGSLPSEAPKPTASFGDAVVQMQRLSLELLERARGDPMRRVMAALDVWDVAVPEGSVLRAAIGDVVEQAVAQLQTLEQHLQDAEMLLVSNCERPGAASLDGGADALRETLWSGMEGGAAVAWPSRGGVLSAAVKAIPLDGKGTQASKALGAMGLDAADALPAWKKQRAARCKAHEHICAAVAALNASGGAAALVDGTASSPVAVADLGAIVVGESVQGDGASNKGVAAGGSSSSPTTLPAATAAATGPASPVEPTPIAGSSPTTPSKKTSSKAAGAASKRASSAVAPANRRVTISDPPASSNNNNDSAAAAVATTVATSPRGGAPVATSLQTTRRASVAVETMDIAVQCAIIDAAAAPDPAAAASALTRSPRDADCIGVQPPHEVHLRVALQPVDQAVQTVLVEMPSNAVAVPPPRVATLLAAQTQTDGGVNLGNQRPPFEHHEGLHCASGAAAAAGTRVPLAPSPQQGHLQEQHQPIEEPRAVLQRLIGDMPAQQLVSLVVPRRLRAEAAIELLQLLAPQERRTFTTEAEAKQLIQARVSHISVQRNDDRSPAAGEPSAGGHVQANADEATRIGSGGASTALAPLGNVSNSVGAALRAAHTMLPNFVHAIMEAVVQGGDVGALCRSAGMASVSSLLAAVPFDRVAADADPETKAAFARATSAPMPVVDAATVKTATNLPRELAAAIRWLSVAQWSLRDCLHAVEDAVGAALHHQQLLAASTTVLTPTNTSSHNHSGTLKGVASVGATTTTSAVALLDVDTKAAPQPVGIRHQRPPSAGSQSMGVYQRLTNSSFGGGGGVAAASGGAPVAVWSSASQKLSTLTTKHFEHFAETKQQQQQWASPSGADVKPLYRYGRADVAPAGHMMPRQFTAEFDVAVRHTLDAVELLHDGGEMPPLITPTTTTPAMVGARMTLPPRAASANGFVNRQKRAAANHRLREEARGEVPVAHVGDAMHDGDGDDGGAEWTAENALYDDFRRQKQLERSIVNGQVPLVTSPTIRCGSAPLLRGNGATTNVSGPQYPTTSDKALPNDVGASRSVVVYGGGGDAGAHHSGNNNGPIVTNFVRPGKVYTTASSRPGSTTGVRSITPSTVVQQPQPLPPPDTISSSASQGQQQHGSRVHAGANSRSDPEHNTYSSKLRRSVQHGHNASVSATLSQVVVPTNRTQRRTTPPASVFQWQKVAQTDATETTSDASHGTTGGPCSSLQRDVTSKPRLRSTSASGPQQQPTKGRKQSHSGKQVQLQQSLDDQVLASIGTPIQEWADAMPLEDASVSQIGGGGPWGDPCGGASCYEDLPSTSFSLVGT